MIIYVNPLIIRIFKNEKTKLDDRKRVKPKRISSCDYAAWDKYDADLEIKLREREKEKRK